MSFKIPAMTIDTRTNFRKELTCKRYKLHDNSTTLYLSFSLRLREFLFPIFMWTEEMDMEKSDRGIPVPVTFKLAFSMPKELDTLCFIKLLS